ncbi:DNA mismatch repair protein MutL [Candidatus Omnitrophus magneticus]|uniref:DNA mismatch repair protein MutL n=1 Tax=Candidatus Omnitrophus magneticus TaxID=1609969 RepID=A0A0F0CIU0_9BACT|nr:DNA mismatch repair protein MutL [Candidatus Omnitrophus magneticus]
MNAPKIHLLEENVIGKISAGEVVEGPNSVIKELTENAIDAGASNIHIEIQDAGETLIRVADNGEGMTKEDAKLACLRHATSKLSTTDDLEKINTFGFRGEALASISAVSILEITSYNGLDETGVYLYLESGIIQKERPIARVRGTTIEIKNLFYNTPARKKFLKQKSTELSLIVKTIGHFILSNPDIDFKLSQNGKTLLRAEKNMTMKERISLVMGGEFADNMAEITIMEDNVKIAGYISKPGVTRKDRDSQIFFVNKRYVKNKFLGDALYGAYISLLERGRSPIALLFISIDPSDIDVNVHPMKLLVKFKKESRIRGIIINGIKKSFNEIKEFGMTGRRIESAADSKINSSTYQELEDTFKKDNPLYHEVQKEFQYTIIKNPKKYIHEPFGGNITSSPNAERDNKTLFEIGGCYIVEIKNNALTITDKHAAHERILYEYFTNAIKFGSSDMQSLLFPFRLDLSMQESILIEKLIPEFKTLGFIIEPFGKYSYMIQGVPAILKDRDIKAAVYDTLSDMKEKDLSKIDALDELAKLTACRSAIKANDPSTTDELEELLTSLNKCELPFTCPHGRPVSFDITINELEKRFHRK